jgi:hypothetical protein
VGSRSISRVHVAVGFVVVLLLPLASWIDGSGQLAWTMFSRTGRYRLELVADGAPINPTELAAFAAPGPTSSALAGADHFKHHDVARATARRHLADIATLACKLRPGATITARLHELVRSTDPDRTTQVTIRCDP